jgi:diadenosine tetraphosphate (Ap4A) HIT family hydrolase
MKFEDIPWKDIVVETKNFVIFNDGFPVSEGHELIVPRDPKNVRHLEECMLTAYKRGRDLIRRGLATGFNVGMNYGESAGQTVPYPHIHLIPRRDGDTENPRGGIRNCIPGKGDY